MNSQSQRSVYTTSGRSQYRMEEHVLEFLKASVKQLVQSKPRQDDAIKKVNIKEEIRSQLALPNTASDSESFPWYPVKQQPKKSCETPTLQLSRKRRRDEEADHSPKRGDTSSWILAAPILLDKDKEGQFMTLNSTMSQLLWILRYMKFNPMKTSEELLEMVNKLCSGIQSVVSVLSNTHFSDIEYQRLLRVSQTYFELIQCEQSSNSASMLTPMHQRTENLFDSFLDYMGSPTICAEGQLQRYAICSALILFIKERSVRLILMNKLLCRIYKTFAEIRKACCDNLDESLLPEIAIMNPATINVSFYYCQLLEATITSTNETGPWIQNSFYKAALAIFEDNASLLAMFPQMSFSYYAILEATKRHVIKPIDILPKPRFSHVCPLPLLK